MTIKKFVAVLSACCSILIYSITAIQVSAITSTPRFIDNDTNVSGYSNSRYGFSEYMSSSSLYYSDARIQNSNNSSYSYHYHFPTVSTLRLILTMYITKLELLIRIRQTPAGIT